MKKGVILSILISIALIIVVILGGYYFFKIGLNKNSIDSGSLESLYCDKNSCPNEEVIIEGDLQRGGYPDSFKLITNNKYIYISFEPNVSFLDILLFNEKNYLLKGGIVKVKVKGVVKYTEAVRIKLIGENIMVINPEDVELIEKVKCSEVGGSLSTLEAGHGCFDFSNYNLKASDAYKKLINSEICTKDNRITTDYLTYTQIAPESDPDSNGMGWYFQTLSNSDPGGCSTYCYVSPTKIILNRQCTDTINNLRLEE